MFLITVKLFYKVNKSSIFINTKVLGFTGYAIVNLKINKICLSVNFI